MKKLQVYAKTVLSVLALSTVLIMSSCKDECKDVTCNNGGTCVSGACDCATGYEGTSCETAWKTKFIRTAASVTETCAGIGYTTDITAGTGVTEIKIKNLGNYICAVDYYVTATSTGSNTIAIASQDVCSNLYHFGAATGTISNGVISIPYTVTYDDDANPSTPDVTDNCTATITQ